MNNENTLKLVQRFPVLYQDFYSPMTQTCMCWGFDHEDGWFDIIWQLSLAIEDELKYTEIQKRWFLSQKFLAKHWNDFIYKLSPVALDKTKLEGEGTKENPYHRVVIEKAKPRLPWLKNLVWHPNTGFAVQQVKEKFGGLCYYCPGNDRIYRLVTLAERLASVTCEVCGALGKLYSEGWMVTLCDKCHDKK